MSVEAKPGQVLNGFKRNVGYFRLHQPSWNADCSKVLFTAREFAGV